MRKTGIIYLAAMLLFGAISANAQVTWNFTNGANASNLPPGITASGLTVLNNNGGTASITSDPPVSSGYPSASGDSYLGIPIKSHPIVIKTTSTYMQVALTPAAGKYVRVTAISLGSYSVLPTGPSKLTIYTNSDNYTTAVAVVSVSQINFDEWVFVNPAFSPISGAVDVPLIIRIYGTVGSPGVTPVPGVINWKADDLQITATAEAGATNNNPNQLAKFATTTSFDYSIVSELNNNIGIGTATPLTKLHLNGLARFENGTNTSPVITAYRDNVGLFEIRSSTKDGETNLFIGKNAGLNADPGLPVYTEANNVALGSLSLMSMTSGFKNTAIGSKTLTSLTVGNFNSAFGNEALASLISGEDNIGFGYSALSKSTTGRNNVAIGTRAGQGNVTGSHNTYVGKDAGPLSTGNWNTFIGYGSGANVGAGSNNVIIGNNNGAGINGLNNYIIVADGQGNERLKINNNGAINTGAGYGLTSQVLVSNGEGASPAWKTVAGISSLWSANANGDIYNTSVEGKVGIGITAVPTGYRLGVAGGIITEELKLKLQSSGWPDYVFADDYQLMSLTEVNGFIKKNKHLPGMAPATEMSKTGIEMEPVTIKLLEKIEELTLYTIELKKELEALKKSKGK